MWNKVVHDPREGSQGKEAKSSTRSETLLNPKSVLVPIPKFS